MKNGPSGSLNPGRHQARQAARARQPRGAPAGGSGLHGAATPEPGRIGEWMLGTDEDGNLTASLPDGTTRVVATTTAAGEV